MSGAAKIPRRGPAKSPEASTPRFDPASWDLNGTDPYWALENLSEDTRHYVWANESERATFGGVDFYESRGYEVEYFRGVDGVRPKVGKLKAGDPIKRHGHVLMSCPLELKAQFESRAQRQHDILVERMVDTTRTTIGDDLRGIPGNRNQDYVQLRRTRISQGEFEELRD